MRKKTTYNPELLKEELNRFKLLETYDYYMGEQKSPEFDDEKANLILSRLSEEDEELDDAAADDIANELGVDAPEGGEPAPEDMGGDVPSEPAPEAAPEPEPAPIEEPASDDVEVDVTELVKGSEEAKMAADKASQNSEMLMQKLSDLEARIASMDAVSGKIAELEQEIIKRNPTPVEKLEMRSLSSYPYSQKLTDYWADKEGPYDVMGKDKEKEEYTLTQDDVDNSYSEGDVKSSFTVNDEENEFDEEDV